MNPWRAVNFAMALLVTILTLSPGNEASQFGQFMVALAASVNLFVGLTTKDGKK